MAELKELQQKALSLGIKKVYAVSKKSLEDQIAEIEAATKSSIESPAKKDESNTAVVLNQSGQEVRRYTREQHGDNFIELAKEFAIDREYTIQFKKVKPGVACPNCGHVTYSEEE